jgi:anti-sigma regulatory factor (Ser/Thr protein kinase)
MTTVAIRPRDPEGQGLNVRLRASLSAPRAARQALAGIGTLARQGELLFISQLLTAELVSNVLRHSNLAPGDEFLLRIDCDDATLAVEVTDAGAGFNPLLLLREHALSDAHHRGLALINALADRWGFLCGTGCRVWFELDLVPGRRPWRGREPIPPSA